jgi:hypothetical protein
MRSAVGLGLGDESLHKLELSVALASVLAANEGVHPSAKGVPRAVRNNVGSISGFVSIELLELAKGIFL